jgi:hypothetical protein
MRAQSGWARIVCISAQLTLGNYMKVMKTVKHMKGGWHASLTWLPGFAGLGL